MGHDELRQCCGSAVAVLWQVSIGHEGEDDPSLRGCDPTRPRWDTEACEAEGDARRHRGRQLSMQGLRRVVAGVLTQLVATELLQEARPILRHGTV